MASKTYADIAKSIIAKYEKRGEDTYAQKSKEFELKHLMGQQETTGQTNSGGQFGKGGKMYKNGGAWAYDAMQFAPVAYNLVQGLLPEKQLNSQDYQVPANIKPYEVDYAPERQQLESSKNALNTEIMNTGNKSTGDIIRNLRASDTSYRNNLSQIYNQQGQQNAAIDMQTKQFNTGIKQQNASTRFAVDDWNQKSYAAKQNMLGSAATNLGAYGQGKASDQTGMNLITSILGEDWDYVNGKLVKRKKV